MKYRCLIFDPIDFRGGSKVAVETIFAEITDAESKSLVLSNDQTSWSAKSFTRQAFWYPSALSQVMHGILFLIKHCFFAVSILRILLRHKDIKLLIATSGPGIDLGLSLIHI